MLVKTLLFLLPALAYGGIVVDVVTGSDEQSASVSCSGSNVDIIPDSERNTWMLNDNQLKQAAQAWSGGWPNDAYLRSPTPWGDLYTTYDWPQVTRTLVPQNCYDAGTTSEPVIVLTQEFINNSSVTATYQADITQNVEQTVSNSWSTGGQLQISQTISYSVKFGIASVGGSTALSYTSSWGQVTSHTQSITLGSSSGVSIVLEPGQSAIATLTATRGTKQVLIQYTATLDGVTACNYSPPYDGHHFWAYDINACLESVGSPREVYSTEVIQIGFYSDAKVTVSDKKSGKKLYEVPVPIV